MWDWIVFNYRVKPPEPLRCWICVFREHDGWLGHAYRSEKEAEANHVVTAPFIRTVPMIELTPEVAAALKAAGIETEAT